MSDEQELKLACLHQAGGNLDHAKSLFDWVSGSVRATPASEAPAVSAPNQDEPEQPFNYQHPSKYGTDVPRRCYLEELTPEERAIRDLVGAIEHLGAHPLLTATVIQLMKAGESLADWVDIGLRDKAIAALTSEPGKEFVEKWNGLVTTTAEDVTFKEADYDKAEGEFELPEPPSPEVASEGEGAQPSLYLSWTPYSVIAPQAPSEIEGYVLNTTFDPMRDEWVFCHVPTAQHDNPLSHVAVGETQSGLDSSSEPQATTEQEQKDEGAPVLDALAQAQEAMSQPAIEEPEPLQNGDASVFAHGILRDFDEPEARRFDLSRLFGKKEPA